MGSDRIRFGLGFLTPQVCFPCVDNSERCQRYIIALAPHNHSLLPNKVLSHIFVLLALDHGPVKFPIIKDNAPPQMALSHVCSHWRRVVLQTLRLWSDTHFAIQGMTLVVISAFTVTTWYGLLHYDYLIRRTGPFIFLSTYLI